MIETGDIQVIIEDGTNANLCQQIAYIKAGKTEIEDAVQEGIGDFNTNATEKTNTFNSNASAKTLAFNQNADAKTLIYDNNASEKLSAYNENATNKLAAYNANDTAKTEAYNLNATNKTTAFNNNASEKASTFNDNAIAKTSGFNSNATSKTNDFNSNASSKTTAFNDNYTAKKALIDAEVATAQGAAETATTKAGQASTYADHAEIWAEGTDEEVQALGGEHSSKGWADQSAQGQVQADWNEADTSAKSYIQNKPTSMPSTWGSISGTLSNQTDLNNALNGKANVGLDNLNADGQMIIDSQNGTISNCILEIPQNLKLEISGNNVIAKAGTIIVDAGSTYTTVTYTQDATYTKTWIANKRYLIFGSKAGTLYGATINECSSGNGSNIPSTGVYFNTSDKNFYLAGTYNQWIAYPVCLIDIDESGNIKGFAKFSDGRDCIFNGLGFIGQTKFIYPNVKVLEPIGKNADGTLKSREYTTDSLQLATSGGTYNRKMYLEGNNFWITNANLTYNKDENLWYQDSTPKPLGVVYLGDCYTVNDIVTDFTIRQPYQGARDLLTDNKQDVLTSITGYDSTQTQTLKNINGVLTWVTD